MDIGRFQDLQGKLTGWSPKTARGSWVLLDKVYPHLEYKSSWLKLSI